MLNLMIKFSKAFLEHEKLALMPVVNHCEFVRNNAPNRIANAMANRKGAESLLSGSGLDIQEYMLQL